MTNEDIENVYKWLTRLDASKAVINNSTLKMNVLGTIDGITHTLDLLNIPLPERNPTDKEDRSPSVLIINGIVFKSFVEACEHYNMSIDIAIAKLKKGMAIETIFNNS